MGLLAVVQEDPCPVFLPHTHMDVGRLKVKAPGADTELILANDGHRRQIDLRESPKTKLASMQLDHTMIQTLAQLLR